DPGGGHADRCRGLRAALLGKRISDALTHQGELRAPPLPPQRYRDGAGDKEAALRSGLYDSRCANASSEGRLRLAASVCRSGWRRQRSEAVRLALGWSAVATDPPQPARDTFPSRPPLMWR